MLSAVLIILMLLPSETTCDRQLRTCIIDPVLALSPYGLPLIKQLRSVMELWVVRELWHILDNTRLYLHQPELITYRELKTSEQERATLEETIWSLKEWERFRLETDLAGLNLFWLGDSTRESFLPKNKNLDNFWRWESIAASLDAHLERYQPENSILSLAFRDAVALTVSLESAFILTRQLPTDCEQNLSPSICQALENWGMPCQVLTPENSIVAIERDYLCQLLISRGLARLFWADVNLAVVHLITTPELRLPPEQLPDDSFSNTKSSMDDLQQQTYSWANARAFWYLIQIH